MKKSFIFLTLALAALFAVAKGDDEITINPTFFDDEFYNTGSNKFAQSVTVTENGKTTAYTIMTIKGVITFGGEIISSVTGQNSVLLFSDDGKYAVFNNTANTYGYDLITGESDGKNWLYFVVYASGGFNLTTNLGFKYNSPNKKYFIVALSTGFNETKCTTIDTTVVPVLGSYGGGIYVIGAKITGINDISSVCGKNTNCFIYDVFEDTPKHINLTYRQTARDFYPIKSYSKDTAIIAVNSDVSGFNGEACLFVLKKTDDKFSLKNETVFGSKLDSAYGEYIYENLYMMAKASSLSIIGDSYEASKTVVFMTRDFSTVEWVHTVPISIFSRYYSSYTLKTYDSESIILAITHDTSYGDYNGTEVFLRGTSDIAVILLNSATGAVRNIKTFGKVDKVSFICGIGATSDNKKLLLNTIIEDYYTGLVNKVQTELEVFTCNNGINNNGECLCKKGYVGEKCNIKCPEENGKICGGNGACYLNEDGDAAACACKNGYVGENCTEKCTTNDNGDICGGDGICYLNNNGNAACLSFPTYGSGSGSNSTIICPECKCNNSDDSDSSNKCGGNGVTGVRPFFLLIGLIALFML